MATTLKKKRRPVEVEAEAAPAKSFLGVVRSDDEYAKFKKVVERTQARVKAPDDLKEAFALHTSRLSPQMYDNKQFSAKSIMEAHSKDLQARSRIEKMRSIMTLHLSYLKEAEKALTQYVTDRYKDEMSDFSNQDQRKAFLGRLTRVSASLMSEMETAIGIFDNLIKDIDQAGFKLNGMLGALELIVNAKGKVL